MEHRERQKLDINCSALERWSWLGFKLGVLLNQLRLSWRKFMFETIGSFIGLGITIIFFIIIIKEDA
jgi:hypothetical protein